MVHIQALQDANVGMAEVASTTHLTINREISALDLDSSNAFEGPEKLLEVWFSSSEKTIPTSAKAQGLKSISSDSWKDMLDLVNCKVLSVVESQNVDAYLLSESSMFVFPHKLVLKTCGTTTLLYGLPRLLELAATVAGFPHIEAEGPNSKPAAAIPYRVFYSRKNFLYPDQQQGPHRSWNDEVRYLDTMFRNGSAYLIGKMNGEHWYLYITTRPNASGTSSVGNVPPSKILQAGGVGDETLEILMTDLEENNARQFYLLDASKIAVNNARRAYRSRKDAIDHLGVLSELNGSDGSISDRTLVNGSGADEPCQSGELSSKLTDQDSQASDLDEDDPLTFSEELTTEGHTLGSVITENCGLADIYPTSRYPEARIDSYLFTPCGYSANGVVPVPEDPESTHYWTVHVTPEPQCSYASFETNVPNDGPDRKAIDLIEQVVNVFKPGRFSVTLFEAQEDTGSSGAGHDRGIEYVSGYRRVDRVLHDLDGYQLVFRYFEREDWGGGAPRLGEVCNKDGKR